MDPLRKLAHDSAVDFLTNDKEFQMGEVRAERPHPLTKTLSQTYAASAEDGVRMLLSVDVQMARRAAALTASPEFAAFADAVRSTLSGGGRVIFSGCGSSGRLSMQLERSWRRAVSDAASKHPEAAAVLADAAERVGNIQTGGDYAVIRAVESFEDSALLGRAQARAWKLTPDDLLIGVTATGETTSVLGTAMQAMEDGAPVYMLICSDPSEVMDKMQRVREVFTHPLCRRLLLPCGPMALTGSTRMQSSTFEQFAGAVALELALDDILHSCGVPSEAHGGGYYGTAFAELTEALASPQTVSLLDEATRREQSVYEAGGLVTLFADEFMLDVLTDTTERAPTFMTPPFRSEDEAGQPLSWAFAKNPCCDTRQAWVRCFLREPRCIEWGRDFYASLGFTEAQIAGIPAIGLSALQKFRIGAEPMPERENSVRSLALWIGRDAPPPAFSEQARRYAGSASLTLRQTGIRFPETRLELFEHIAVKLMLNTLSTGVMARMGRITGNWMTNLAMSNKKLIDRSARIVADQCGVSYARALEENFYSRELLKKCGQSSVISPAQLSIRRLSEPQNQTGASLPEGGGLPETKVVNTMNCKIVAKETDVYFDMALTMLEEILRHNERGEKTVFIVPVGPTDQYPLLAEMVNRLRVSLKNVHFFNMDEYLLTPTTVIARDDPMSFYGRMKREFYDRVDPELVMPESRRHFPEPGHEAEYDRMLADLGGADVCFGGLGINGHVAFNEPPEPDTVMSADDFAELGTRVLSISRETRTINAYGYQRGDLMGMPEYCITIGMKSILASKKIYIALNRAWQNGPLKHALRDEETARVPASLLRRCQDVTFCGFAEVMDGIV